MRARFRLRTVALGAALTTVAVVPLGLPAYAVATTSTLVAYTVDEDGDGAHELYTRAAHGIGSPTRLFANTYDVWLPSLSPDGTTLAYLMDDGSQSNHRLFVRPADGSGSPTLLLNKAVTGSVGWSVDGTRLVASAYDKTADTRGTYVVDADGSDSPALVAGTDTVKGLADEPAFAPSGEQLAVDAFDAGLNHAGIDLLTLSTGARARIAGTEGGSNPLWSPDGQSILFERELATCGIGLYRVPAGGGAVTTVREVPGYALGSAEFSRDGSQIFLTQAPMPSTCGTTTPVGEIWVIGSDGDGAQPVGASPGDYETGATVTGGEPVPADTTAPAAPVLDAAGTVTATTATVSWTATDPDTTDFVVVRVPHGDGAPASPAGGAVVYHGPAHSATVTGLTAGTAYDFYVFASDSSGNDSPVSAAHSARPTAPPTMAGIGRVGTTTTTPTFSVGWQGDGAAYEVMVGEKKKSASGVWSTTPAYQTWVESTTDQARDFTGAQGRTYYFRARAVDGFGNATPYATTASTAHVPINETWTGFTSSSGWVAKTSTAHYLGTYRTTITKGAYVKARVDTARFVLIGDKCATCGRLRVYVDGVLKATVDSYAPATTRRQVLYTGGVFGTVSAHSIRVEAAGTAGRPRVSIDGLALQR